MRRLAIAFILFLSFAHFAVAQEIAADSKTSQPLASRHLYDVRLRGYGVRGLLSDLSLWYDIPIGLEVAMNSSGFGRLRMDFKKATLEEVLNRVVTEHPEYAWEIKDGVVNVFPKEGRQDPIVKQVLGTEIGTLSIEERTTTWDVEKALVDTPELSAVMKTQALTTPGWWFSGFYFPNVGRDFNLHVSNRSVRLILNTIVKESKTAKFWSVSRDSAEHTLSINMNAHQENIRKLMRKADVDDLQDSFDLIP